jgi:hypothetical protein
MREPKETLLDRFAMAALPGLLTSPAPGVSTDSATVTVVRTAYLIAEAMMEERRDRLEVVVPTCDHEFAEIVGPTKDMQCLKCGYRLPPCGQ